MRGKHGKLGVIRSVAVANVNDRLALRSGRRQRRPHPRFNLLGRRADI
jgi:hypothetical protein